MHYDDNNNHTYNQTASDRSKPPNPHPNFFLEKNDGVQFVLHIFYLCKKDTPTFFLKKNDGVQFVLNIFYL